MARTRGATRKKRSVRKNKKPKQPRTTKSITKKTIRIDKKDDITNENSSTDDDFDFEPTAEMMVHDFDDETTLWEDELSESAYQEELYGLEKDNELSIEQIRKNYAIMKENFEKDQMKLSSSTSKTKNNNNDDDGEYIPKKSYRNDKKNGSHNLRKNNFVIPARSKRNTSRQAPRYVYGSDYEDSDYIDKNGVKIGKKYQVELVPICYTLSTCIPVKFPADYKYQLWNPHITTVSNVNNYFKKLKTIPEYSSQPYEDFALTHFFKNNCSIKLALENIDELITSIDNHYLKWSIKDCEDFELGVSNLGKDFFTIKEKYIPHKSYLEVIEFYYKWKKSERADQFAAKLKEKSKSKRFVASIFDYLGSVMNRKKLPYKLSEDGVHYDLDDTSQL